MPRIYSHFHSIPDFIGQCIPKRGAGPYGSMFVHQVIDGLKRLDRVQQTNRAVTLPFDVDGINVFHAGRWLCKIFPGQTGLKVAFDGGGVSQVFDEAVKQGLAIDKTIPSYRAWTVLPEGMEVIWKFVENLDHPSDEDKPEIGAHPRSFPPAARQEALEAFIQSGRMCPGHGRQKRHRLEKDDRIELDHILPYSMGGASSDWNIQVLCEECNRTKRARCD